RVLHGDARDIASMQILDGIDRRGIDPARAGRRDDEQHRALERTGALELLEREARALLGGLGGVEPDIDSNRRLDVAAEERPQVFAGRTAGDELAARAAE